MKIQKLRCLFGSYKIELNVPISELLLIKTENDLEIQMGIEFTTNLGWLEHLKKNNGIAMRNVSGETNHIHLSLSSDQQRSILYIYYNYKMQRKFSLRKNWLIFRCLPNKTLIIKRQLCTGQKTGKEYVTVLKNKLTGLVHIQGQFIQKITLREQLTPLLPNIKYLSSLLPQ